MSIEDQASREEKSKTPRNEAHEAAGTEQMPKSLSRGAKKMIKYKAFKHRVKFKTFHDSLQ
jgi:hypothetical protein